MREQIFGIDFDGTICNTSALKQKYVSENLGVSIEPWQANRTVLIRELKLMNETGYDRMIDAICNVEGTLSAKPMPKAKESLARLSGKGSIFVVTGRDDTYLLAAVKWMKREGLDCYVKGYISSKSRNKPKAEICREMNITHMIDDDPGHFEEMSDGVVGILIRHGYDGGQTDDVVKHASSWDEAVKYLI